MIKELTIEKTGLPVGWEMKELGKVSVFSQGIQVGLKKHISTPKEGYVRFIRIVDYTQNTLDIRYVPDPGEKYYVEEDDIVMVRYGSPGLIGRGKSGVIANNLFRIKINIENLTNDYLSLFLSQYKIQKYLSSQGSATMPALNFGQLKTVNVLFPKSITQQKQIVAILDKAFAAIDNAKANAEQNLQNAKELFESYLQNVFENKGDDWEMKALGEICEMIKRGSQPKYTESADGEIVLNQKCIRDHKINLSVARKHDTSKKTINKERYIQLGDGLINSTGTGTLGRVAQVRELDFSAFVDTHITIVRPKKEVFYLDFFGWALIYIEKIIQKSGEGASGQTELSRKVVEKLIISYPNEMKQQKKIVQKLDSLSVECKKIEAIYAQKIADLEEMKKSVLQKAFSGQLNTIN